MKEENEWVSTGNYLLDHMFDKSIPAYKISMVFWFTDFKNFDFQDLYTYQDLQIKTKKLIRLNKLNQIFDDGETL